jgi:hypothetical protein
MKMPEVFAELAPQDRKLRESRIPLAMELLAGIWLVIAAFAFNYAFTLAGEAGKWNNFACGVVIALVALVELFTQRTLPWLGLINVAVGFWLIVAPFALGYPAAGPRDAAKTNEMIVGVLVSIFSVIAVTVAVRRSRSSR